MKYKKQPKFHQEARVRYNRQKAAILKSFNERLSAYESSDWAARQWNEPTMRTSRPSEVERDSQLAEIVKPAIVKIQRKKK